MNRHLHARRRSWLDRHGKPLGLLILGASALVVITATAVWLGGL